MLTLPQLAVSGVCILIATLAYGSQLLFLYLEPGPLVGNEWWCFNVLVGCIWISYARSCLADPGNLAKVQPAPNRTDSKDTIPTHSTNANQVADRNGVRWCRKCEAYKPPRAHHCKICKRCIPKMDHHCPWTANCVSHRTLPHFVRFLVYASLSMTYLARLQLGRILPIWHARYLPAYLGPSPLQLSALFLLSALNALTLFAVGIIMLRTVYSLAINVTAVESWEIERHEMLVRKARKHGGHLDGPDGQRVRIEKQEFPYDIGIWSNISQGMGGSMLPVVWAWPFAATPSAESGMMFEENEFESPDKIWPPPDPEKMAWRRRGLTSRIAGGDMLAEVRSEVLFDGDAASDQERLRAFKERQDADLRRRGATRGGARGRESTGWRNAEGEELADFGVDDEEEEGEAVENAYSESESSDSEYSENDSYCDDDDIPLGELITRARKKAA